MRHKHKENQGQRKFDAAAVDMTRIHWIVE